MDLKQAVTFSDKIKDLLLDWGFSSRIANYVAEFFGLFLIVVISVIIYYIVKYLTNRFLRRVIVRSKSRWDDYLYENKVFTRLALIIPPLIINSFLSVTISQYPKTINFLQIVLEVYSAGVLILVANSFLNAVYHIYSDYEVANSKPIKGYVQIGRIFVYVVGSIVVISMLIGQSPLTLLAGLGAMSAVLLLIFKDSILGFVAGVQISNNNMMRIGDWVSVPKHNADGIVIDISLVIVKIRNFDNSIVTIPTYTFISDSAFNWRGMMQDGGRRLKKSFLLDMTTIRPVDEQIRISLAGLEIPANAYDGDPLKITNLTLLRTYLGRYLMKHPSVNQQNTVLVHLLQPSENGMPVEVLAYSVLEDYVDFENFQSSLFEHIFAILPLFGLKILQRPGPVVAVAQDIKNS